MLSYSLEPMLARSAMSRRMSTVTVSSSLAVYLMTYNLSASFAMRISVFSKYLIMSSGSCAI